VPEHILEAKHKDEFMGNLQQVSHNNDNNKLQKIVVILIAS